MSKTGEEKTTVAPTRRSQRRTRRIVRRTVQIVAALVAGALVTTAAVVGVSGARAAAQGPGYGTWPSSAIGWEGAFVAPDGSLIYCIVPGAANPTGATQWGGYQTTIASDSPFGTAWISGDTAAKINTLVSVWGQTWDDVEASAISFAVKHLANPGALYASSGWTGGYDLDGYIHHKLVGLIGADRVAAIQARTHVLLDAVSGTTAGVVDGSGWFDLITGVNSYDGTITMRGTSATGTVSLTNATFDATGSSAMTGMREGVTYGIRGVPPTDDGAGYRVGGYGVFGSGYAPQLQVWTTPGQQTAVGPGGTGTFTVSGWDAWERSVAFAPYITTQVEQQYVPGGRFVDTVTFHTSLNEWPRYSGGDFAVVSATATVYATPERPAAPSAAIPADAKAVGTLRLESDPSTGPSQPYRVESDWELPGPGHYTAVWTITGAEQSAQTAAHLEGGSAYHRQELFGEASQMTMVPDITSEAQATARKGGSATDTVIVADVLPPGGATIATAVYRVPDGTAPIGACVADNLVWRSDPRRIETVGRYTFTAPALPEFGEYAWQHDAVDPAGTPIMTSECGIESEMTRVPVPTIDSRAPETTGYGGLVQDVAIVDGPIPADGETFVTFALFRLPDGGDPIGACTADTLVGDTTDRPVRVTRAGEYTSPGIRATESGIHFSVETLWWRDADGGEPIVLDRGDCGRIHERTIVTDAALRTNAVPHVGVGGAYWDEAIVEGLADDVDAVIVFDVYRNRTGQAPTCTLDTRVATSRVPITGSGVFRSPELTATEAGRELWVATLEHTPDGATEARVLAQGECGEADEVTLVSASMPTTLPLTGGATGVPAMLLSAGIVVLTGTSIVCARAARRSRIAG